jgi:CBS domain-containing protein
MKKIKDIMTREVITVAPDTKVPEIATIFIEKRINGLPVVDENGNLTGVVTQADLIDQNKNLHIPTVISLLDSFIFLENPKKIEKELKKMAGITAGDICSKDIITVNEDDALEDVATIMAERKVDTIPVLREGKIVGIVGRIDIIRSMVK